MVGRGGGGGKGFSTSVIRHTLFKGTNPTKRKTCKIHNMQHSKLKKKRERNEQCSIVASHPCKIAERRRREATELAEGVVDPIRQATYAHHRRFPQPPSPVPAHLALGPLAATSRPLLLLRLLFGYFTAAVWVASGRCRHPTCAPTGKNRDVCGRRSRHGQQTHEPEPAKWRGRGGGGGGRVSIATAQRAAITASSPAAAAAAAAARRHRLLQQPLHWATADARSDT